MCGKFNWRTHSSKKNPPVWVIAYEPEGPDSRYYGLDGKPTTWHRAAEFLTRDDAQQFADKYRIEIGGLVSIVIKRYGQTM